MKGINAFFGGDEVSPCDRCEKRELCEDWNLACRSYVQYFRSGSVVTDIREPTRGYYEKIFKNYPDPRKILNG